MKKSYLYVSLLGFNVLVLCATLLIWYYFTNFDVEIDYTPSPHKNMTGIVNENTISKFSWLANAMYKDGGIGKICTSNVDIGCDYQIPPMKVYQIDSFVGTLRLMNIAPNEPYSVYSGFFKYHERYYAIAVHTNVYYLNYIFYGVSSSIIGTLGILIFWKRFQHKFIGNPQGS